MNQATDYENRRQSERKTVSRLLRVIDAGSRRLLGNVVNLSREGFMLISSEPLAQGELSRLTLELPDESEQLRVSVTARCMWCQKSSFSEDYGAGFQIEDMASEDAGRLRQVFGV